MTRRESSTRSDALRHGFLDPGAAVDRFVALGLDHGLWPAFGRVADPDLALATLIDLAAASDDREALGTALNQGAGLPLLHVLGASTALGRHLVRQPSHWPDLIDVRSEAPEPARLRTALLRAVGADPADSAPTAGLPDAEAVDALRIEYRRLLARVAARDLALDPGVGPVAAELADLAGATLEAALAIARARLGERAGCCRLAVVAMGKCGGRELNYVSDVDVIFVAAAAGDTPEMTALRAASQLAAHMMQVCSDHTKEGTIWPVDAALRPEGNAGPLVRTPASHASYYDRWAKTWEFQALLKARPVCGDLALAEEYLALVRPKVWNAAGRDRFVDDVQAMRRKVLDHIPAGESARQLKLGSGGLRDVEFAVQLLQLVHGRTDESLREPATFGALTALTDGGYIGRSEGKAMAQAYAFLRTMEHRIQLHHLRRTHLVPTDQLELRRLGRAMGYLRDPIETLESRWAHHRREVRRLHEKLFYRPLLSAVARVSGEDSRLSTDAAETRLAALGYGDPAAALRHLEALTAGVSRTAAIQRTLLPVMLTWFADSPDPDAGLLGFRRISDSLGRTHWYLRMLRDEGQVAERLARVLGTSRYATDLLQREPQGVRLLGEELSPLAAEALVAEMTASAERQDDLATAVQAVRAVRRRELLRIAVGDLVGETTIDAVGEGLSRLTDATLEATLAAASAAEVSERGLLAAPTRVAIVAMGRYGGGELSYASDADVLFVHDPIPEADPTEAAEFAHAVANGVRRALATPGPDPVLEVDADLRPEGKQGPLVRTIDSYAAYYAKWSKVWEAQALLRADATIGDPDVCARFTALIDPLRFPTGGLSTRDVIEIRRLKARVDKERLPRGADPATHFKLGPGGLADVEWTVQLLQMRHGGELAGLRTPRTIAALEAATAADLVSAEDAEALARAWRGASRLRNAVTLVRGRAADQLPRDIRERSAVAAVLGYPAGQTDRMLNDYLRITRRSRQAVDRLFWDEAIPGAP